MEFVLVDYARYFAIGAHGEQRRKYINEPYWRHCEGVVNILSKHYISIEAYIVGWLHDTVEDTWVTCFDIQEHFSPQIAKYVSDLTMPTIGNRKQRLEEYNKVLADSCELVQTVKCADLIHNTSSIEKYDPDFAKVYFAEKRELLPLLTKAESTLHSIEI